MSAFFSRLRSLAINVERDVAAVQEEAKNPPVEGAAVTTLYNINKELKQLQV